MTNLLRIQFANAAEDWLENIEPEIKYSSFVRYYNIVHSHLLPEFAVIPVSEITREHVNRYRKMLLTSGGRNQTGLDPSTVTIILSVFRRILTYSSIENESPVADLSSISVRQQYKPLRTFSLQEQQMLNQYLSENISFPNIGILLTLYTGLRIGEVCALKWRDISLNDWNLYVHQTMQRIQTFQESPRTRITITEPKSACSIRHIPIPDFLHRILIKMYPGSSCYFLTGDPVRYIEPRSLENQFARILKRLNIQDAKFHTLRHTFATRCVEQGFDIKTLSEILGHSSVNITMNRYVHPSLEFKWENMNKLSDLFVGDRGTVLLSLNPCHKDLWYTPYPLHFRAFHQTGLPE